MKSLELTLTAATEILEFEKQEIEQPTLPIKPLIDQKEFEKRVQALRKEYESQKPVGNFF